jgi:hypothetical protein
MFLLFTSCWFTLHEHKSVQYEINLPVRVTYIAVSRSRNNVHNNVQNNPPRKTFIYTSARQLLSINANDMYSGEVWFASHSGHQLLEVLPSAHFLLGNTSHCLLRPCFYLN